MYIRLLKSMRLAITQFRYTILCLMFFLLVPVARGDDLPSYCVENPILARELSRMGPVMGMGSSVSHGLLARSASEVVADQLCIHFPVPP